MTTKLLLAVAATFEAITGLVLVIAPNIARLLLDTDISGAVVVMTRVGALAVHAVLTILFLGVWLKHQSGTAGKRSWT